MAKKAAFESIRIGSDPRKESKGTGAGGSGGQWLKVEGGQAVDVTVLVNTDEILACEQCAIWRDDGDSPVWVYGGADDPSHDLKGVDRRYRAYLPLLVDGEVKVWSMGKASHMQLLDIADAGGALKGMVVRIKRTGLGLATRYSIVPTGKRRDVSKVEEVDVIPMLGPLTTEGVQTLIAEKFGLEDYEEVLNLYRGKKERSTRVSTRKKQEAEESIDDDDDDLELI